MTHFLVKILATALVVAAASELGKRFAAWGAALASLPLTSILVLSWLYLDTKDAAKVSSLSTSIFWAVLPSLLFFLVLPFLLKRGWGYWPALGVSSAAMFAGYTAYAALLGRLGVTL
ncbi:MAG: hypothetical protein A2V88_14245 [Elusimicrobia bacterium RBG_16_66_12]|nr:MAG: hypothetical protein A2V88_14245 [Elusimicrobia bacterium RBG_16_66_12]